MSIQHGGTGDDDNLDRQTVNNGDISAQDPLSNPIPPQTVSVLNRCESQPGIVWDRVRRELRYGDVVVKQFKWPAENQEAVLNAFEDLGWPRHIEDPLPRHPEICPKRRLHDTLKCLNRKQINGLIKFRGDGTGKGVLLEIVPEKKPTETDV